MKKKITKTIIIILIILVLFALLPKSIGNDHPIDGLVRNCYGIKYKRIAKQWNYLGKDYEYHNYYCLGIPYASNPKTGCFSPFFIKGYCGQYGL